jgi:hypothetical protein
MQRSGARKTALLLWRLAEWNIRKVTYQPYPFESSYNTVRWEATQELLGYAEYVHNGHNKLRDSRIVYCATCGKVHQLPISMPIYMVRYCILCAPSYIDVHEVWTPLDGLLNCLRWLPVEVVDEFMDILADKFFEQLDA